MKTIYQTPTASVAAETGDLVPIYTSRYQKTVSDVKVKVDAFTDQEPTPRANYNPWTTWDE